MVGSATYMNSDMKNETTEYLIEPNHFEPFGESELKETGKKNKNDVDN